MEDKKNLTNDDRQLTDDEIDGVSGGVIIANTDSLSRPTKGAILIADAENDIELDEAAILIADAKMLREKETKNPFTQNLI